jgi:hypothetical protein
VVGREGDGDPGDDAGALVTRGVTGVRGVPSEFCVAIPPSADNPSLSL